MGCPVGWRGDQLSRLILCGGPKWVFSGLKWSFAFVGEEALEFISGKLQLNPLRFNL